MKTYVDAAKLQEYTTKLVAKLKTIFPGTPLTASTVAGMTDTTRVYVYTGSETGYTAGNWYYWDGTAWTSGGIYQSSGIETDTTLSVAGKAADGKATGDAIAAAKAAVLAEIAPAYSTSGTYAVGDYVIYNSGLYRCVSAISTAESWTAAHWVSVDLAPDLGGQVSALKTQVNDISYEKIQIVRNNDVRSTFIDMGTPRSGSKQYNSDKTAITITSAATISSYFQAFLLKNIPAYVDNPYVKNCFVFDMEYSSTFDNLDLILYGARTSDRVVVALEKGNNKHIRIFGTLTVTPQYVYLYTSDTTQTEKTITVSNMIAYYGSESIPPYVFLPRKILPEANAAIVHRALVIADTVTSAQMMPVEDLNRHGFGVELTTYANFARNYTMWMNEYDVLVISNNPYGVMVPVWEPVTLSNVANAIGVWKNNGKKIIYYIANHLNRITKMTLNGTAEVQSLDNVFPITIERTLNVPSTASFQLSENCPSALANCRNTEYANAAGAIYSVSGDNLVNVIDVIDGTNAYHCCSVKSGEYAVVALAGNGQQDSGNYRYVDIGALAAYLIGDANNLALAQDLIANARILSFGIDGDVTTDPSANKVFVDAFQNRGMEIGLRTDFLTDELADTYRNMFGSERYCTHGKYHSTNKINGYVQTATIPAGQVVYLDYYCFAEPSYTLTSVTSPDGSVVYSSVNAGTTLTAGKYILDRDAGTLMFASVDIGNVVKITYNPLDEGKDWIPSIPELNSYNLQSNDSAYLTSHQHSISGQTYQQMVNRGYIFSDHIDRMPRCKHMLGRNCIDRVVPFTSPTWYDRLTQDGYDSIVYGGTRANALSVEVPKAWTYAEEHNEPIMWYSHDFTTCNGDTRGLYNGTRFNADWSRESYVASMSYLKQFFADMIYYFSGERAGKWITRSEFSWRYYYLQKYVQYHSTEDGFVVRNTGGKLVKGITFRFDSSAAYNFIVSADGDTINYSYNGGKNRVWFDLRPGEEKKIILQ